MGIKLSLIVILTTYSTLSLGTVHLMGQWHLGTKVQSTDIENSKKMPQFLNQKDIYDKTVSIISKGKSSVLIQEGCEGEISSSFDKNYNGWTMKKLIKVSHLKSYSDIIAPIGMKIKAKFPKVKVLCGDDLSLMKEHQLALSEVRGFSGFYMRLKKAKGKNPKIFKAYKDQLQKLYKDKKIEKPIEFTRKKALEFIDKVDRKLKERNIIFEKVISQQVKSNPIVILGDAHSKHLIKLLEKKKIKVDYYKPKGLEGDSSRLILKLRELLGKK